MAGIRDALAHQSRRRISPHRAQHRALIAAGRGINTRCWPMASLSGPTSLRSAWSRPDIQMSGRVPWQGAFPFPHSQIEGYSGYKEGWSAS